MLRYQIILKLKLSCKRSVIIFFNNFEIQKYYVCYINYCVINSTIFLYQPNDKNLNDYIQWIHIVLLLSLDLYYCIETIE